MKGSNMDVVKYVNSCWHINYYNIDTVTKRHILKATIILLPLLGMTWVFGLLAVNENTAVFAWLFTIFNSLQAGLISRIETEHYCLSLTQGVFIFFFHVLRNKTVSVHLCSVKTNLHVYSACQVSSRVHKKFSLYSSTISNKVVLLWHSYDI